MLNAREPGRMMLPLSQQSENAFCTIGVAKEVPAMALIKEFNVLMENRSGTPLPRLATSEKFLAFLMAAGSTRSLRLLGATPAAKTARLLLA